MIKMTRIQKVQRNKKKTLYLLVKKIVVHVDVEEFAPGVNDIVIVTMHQKPLRPEPFNQLVLCQVLNQSGETSSCRQFHASLPLTSILLWKPQGSTGQHALCTVNNGRKKLSLTSLIMSTVKCPIDVKKCCLHIAFILHLFFHFRYQGVKDGPSSSVSNIFKTIDVRPMGRKVGDSEFAPYFRYRFKFSLTILGRHFLAQVFPAVQMNQLPIPPLKYLLFSRLRTNTMSCKDDLFFPWLLPV